MKNIYCTILLCLLLGIQTAYSQSYFDGKFQVSSYTYQGNKFKLFVFSRDSVKMRAKYFAQNAYSQYQQWKRGKQILLVTAGAFSDGWNPEAKPVGLCVDNGTIVTRLPNQNMDGMVIVYNGAAQIGGVTVVDMDINPVNVQDPYGSSNKKAFRPRSSSEDRINFLNWGSREGVTLFQTQLVYSSDRTSNFTNLTYGDKRERRFLAICRRNGIVHHVVVDAPGPLELNLSASYTKAVLERDGFNVLYIMNLDTGDKNVLHAWDGSTLKDYRPCIKEDCVIEKATNLLVYYKE